MTSLCIKTNNEEILKYLLKNLKNTDLENIHFSKNQFKFYKNIIVHYTGSDLELFYNNINNILTDCVITFFESPLISRLLQYDYFYLDDYEKNIIKNEYISFLNSNFNERLLKREIIWSVVSEYIKQNKVLFLEGFVNFRLFDYVDFLDNNIGFIINKFIIDKEYNEFINLLKLYISSRPPETGLIHIIYTQTETILLDEAKNIISYPENITKIPYLSDISFSSSDYALNTLLTILPKQICIHLISESDDFINTLKLIFANKVLICTDCNICKTYSLLNKV